MRKKGVKPVDLFGVVHRLQRTAGSSSSQQSAERSSGSTRRGLMPDRMRPLAHSTCLLDCGCATEARSRRMPEMEYYCVSVPLAKLVLLLVMMLFGMP